MKEIHIDLRYGIDVKKPYSAQVITDHAIKGPFNLHFGERKTPRPEITMPSARLGKDKCNMATAEAIDQALRKPGTGIGPLELREASIGEKAPSAEKAVSERRGGKEVGYPNRGSRRRRSVFERDFRSGSMSKLLPREFL